MVVYNIFFILIGLIVIANGKMGNDEGIWSYIARVWSEHQMLPYKDSVDDKTPGILLVYRLSYELLGVNYLLPRLLGFISVVITGNLLYSLSNLFFRKEASLITVITFSGSMLWSNVNGSYLGQTEIFMILFTTLTFYLLATSHVKMDKVLITVIAGASIGAAVCFKQVAILSAFAVLYVMAYELGFSKKCFLNVSFLASGALFSIAIFHIPVISSNNLEDYIYWAWLNPTLYPSFWWRIPNFFEAFFSSKLILFYPIFLIGLIYKEELKRNSGMKFILPWLIGAFIGVNISGYYYGHQLTQIIPPISLIIGSVINLLKIKQTVSFKYLVISTIILVLPYSSLTNNAAVLINGLRSAHTSFTAQYNGRSDAKELGKWLSSKSHCQFVFNYSRDHNPILSYSDKKSASKFLNAYENIEIQREIARDLARKKPKFVIKRSETANYSKLDSFVKRNYFEINNFSKWKILKRIN